MDNMVGAMAIAVPVISALAWLMSIQGRVMAHDRELRDVKEDVRYIRDRIDRALNGRHE
ncbi:MAG: hypothetical protein VW405_01045 [Rhodospirillaceae bacterium]